MSRDKIIYMPLDERPCNYDYPDYIAAVAGIETVKPPLDMMGKFKKAADTQKLWQWLFEQAKSADYAVISMDLLLYGGIVPSRLHHIQREECKNNADKLRRLKAENPNLKIFAFQLIMRAPGRNGAGEEPDYYEQHGYDIHRFGYVCDKESLGVADENDFNEKSGILSRVPQQYLDDFILRREVNFSSNINTIDMAADGVIDHLIIPLDDCMQYGYAPSERRRIAKYLGEKNMLSRVSMYPAADEIGCTLTARAVCGITGVQPSICLDSDSVSGMTTIPSYEDRTIAETAPHHILNAGAVPALSSQSCDAVMLLHPPTEFSQRLEKQLDRREIYVECERNLPAAVCRLRQHMAKDTPCFVADCAIPNGADKYLMRFLHEQEMLDKIKGYSGWNTSSNALGTVMAHAVAYVCAQKSGHLDAKAIEISDRFRFYRYLEDWGYMTEVRKTLTENLPQIGSGLSFLKLCDKEPQVSAEAEKMMKQFARKYFPDSARTFTVHMPWNRMFEIELSNI
ncbi:MAG: DUF4127 family protein [Ruminococcaceae bacterium]|nr:DUF4127 family protein [Oscillospiraceae bacterium]